MAEQRNQAAWSVAHDFNSIEEFVHQLLGDLPVVVRYAFELDEAGTQYMDHVFFDKFDIDFPNDEKTIVVTGEATVNGSNEVTKWVVSAELEKFVSSRDALTLFAEAVNNVSRGKSNPHNVIVVKI